MTRFRIAALFAAAICLSTTGCESGLRIGNTWLVRPTVPLAATRVQITRYRLTDRKHRADERKLVVDLYSGRTSLIDPEGRSYPSQLTNEAVEELRNAIADRSWMASGRPARGADNVFFYEVTAFDGDRRIGGRPKWAIPASRQLPEALNLLARTFNRADRIAHPLANEFNLID